MREGLIDAAVIVVVVVGMCVQWQENSFRAQLTVDFILMPKDEHRLTDVRRRQRLFHAEGPVARAC